MALIGGLLGSAPGVNLLSGSVSNLFGQPMQTWSAQVAATNEWRTAVGRMRGYLRNPILPPSPDQLIAAVRRKLITPASAQWYLAQQGIPWGGRELNEFRVGTNVTERMFSEEAQLWANISALGLDRPNAGAIVQLWSQRRLTTEQLEQLSHHLDADLRAYATVSAAQYQTIDIDTAISMYHMGDIDDDLYRKICLEQGWWHGGYRDLLRDRDIAPSIPEATNMYYRGAIDLDKYARLLRANGARSAEAQEEWTKAMRPMPTPSDLVLFAVREVWDTDARRRLGYDREFPEPFRHFMAKQGLDWGEAFQGNDGRSYPSVNWPLAYWVSHWRTMSPTEAYRAVHLLRPDRIQRYRDISPGVTPFTVQDLHAVLKVADYPEPIRKWLAAIAFQPLRLVDIRAAFQAKVKDRSWAINQLLDRGYVREDAETAVDLWSKRDEQSFDSARRAFARATFTGTVKEVLGGYADGLLTREVATERLADMGFNRNSIGPMLDLEESKLLRSNVKQFLSITRREYLQGALSRAELLQSLAAAGISAPRAQQILSRWTVQLTAERRSLSTSQIVQAVAAGRLPQAAALLRLERLGWTPADASLLLAQAVDRLTRARATAAQQAVRSAQQRAQQLRAAQTQALAAARTAQSRLKSIYPLATLKRQYCLGIRKAPTIRAILQSQGYSKDAIDNLLLEWTHECEASPPNPDARVGSVIAYNKRQTPLSMLKDWWQNGIITDKWARKRLAAIGLEEGTVKATVKLWESTLGGKSGPAPEGSPEPAQLP